MKEASESSDKEKTCKRPDGNIITFGSKRFRCPKVLFQPNFIGKEASGIQDTTSRPSCRPIWTSAKISTATSCFRDGTTCYAFEASHGGNPCLVTQLLRTKFRRMASRNGLASVARTHPKVRCHGEHLEAPQVKPAAYVYGLLVGLPDAVISSNQDSVLTASPSTPLCNWPRLTSSLTSHTLSGARR